MRLFALICATAAAGFFGCSNPVSHSPAQDPAAAGKLTTSASRAGGLGKPGFKTLAQLKRRAFEPDGGVEAWTAERLKGGRTAVRVPAGSVDALAAALDQAGPDGRWPDRPPGLIHGR